MKTVEARITSDAAKYRHLVGMAQNSGNSTVKGIIATVVFLDKDNKTLGNFSKQAALTTLNPAESTPFDILAFDKKINDKVSDYRVDYSYSPTKHKDKKLTIVSDSSRLDITGFYFISGKVQNTEKGSPANNTRVTAITYNKNNEILGTWSAQSEPYTIPPSSEASFTIPVTDKTQSFQVSKYRLFVESDNLSGLK